MNDKMKSFLSQATASVAQAAKTGYDRVSEEAQDKLSLPRRLEFTQQNIRFALEELKYANDLPSLKAKNYLEEALKYN